jgi:hypothetical protein
MMHKPILWMMPLFLAAGLAARPARACTFVAPTQHQVDPSMEGVDTTPPERVRIRSVKVYRDPSRSPGLNCWDGYAAIRIADPRDDMTSPEQMGFRYEVVDGDAPDLFQCFYPGPIKLRRNADGDMVVFLPWMETEPDRTIIPPVRFTVRITPIDLAGNEGPPVDVVVQDPANDTGCSATRASGGQGLAWLIAGLLAAMTCFRLIARGRSNVRTPAAR